MTTDEEWAAQGTHMGELCVECWGSERDCVCAEPDFVAVYRYGKPDEAGDR